MASTLLHEAETSDRLVEAGVARHGVAASCYLSGDFVEARTHCERALAVCARERDRETRERFGEDIGAVALSWLALTMWQLGEVDRARELIEQANQRARDLGHVQSLAHPLLCKSHLGLVRGEPAAALSAAEALETLSQEHGMAFWRVVAELDAAWARGRLYDAAAGATDLRRALAAVTDQGGMGEAWFHTVLLAELEAHTLGLDSALARIDEALSLARHAEVRCDLSPPRRNPV
jgi:ATP/maltotriose-dependent transcriptional regulator MalT